MKLLPRKEKRKPLKLNKTGFVMMKTKLEYIWLDGYKPEPNLRSKIKIVSDYPSDISEIPSWSFDGSSTQQAEGHFSDCILRPVRMYSPDLFSLKIEEYPTVYVLCEVLNADGTPHESNWRSTISDNSDLWIGFEQEYFIRSSYSGSILGFQNEWLSPIEPQGKYYCGIGGQMVGRDISDKHLHLCLDLGIGIEGTNAEVALGQWEYQIFSKGGLKAADDLWMSRYLLYKLAESHGYDIEVHPKPMQGWNGSGLHTNFSTKKMREDGGKKYFDVLFQTFEERKDLHIQNYGSDNHLRLTGKYETQDINKFTWGISDRGASIRVSKNTAESWKGYLEDRRPASNADPYRIVSVITDTLNLVD